MSEDDQMTTIFALREIVEKLKVENQTLTEKLNKLLEEFEKLKERSDLWKLQSRYKL